MANSSFRAAQIAGVVTVVPPTVKCIDDEVQLYGGNENQIKRIKKAIGLDKRHVVGDDNITALDLSVSAATSLIKMLDLDKSQIDGLIFVTQTPDHFQPSNAAIAHGRLELTTDVASFDVSLGCSGYVYGLWLAHMMVETGACSNILLLAGDTLSVCVNKRDRSTAPLFGDAGSATLIKRGSQVNNSFFSLHTDGSGYENIIQPAGAFRLPVSEKTQQTTVDEDGNHRSDNNLKMNGAEVFNFSIKREPESIKEILEYSSKSLEAIDYVFFHQANQYIISNIVRRVKLDKNKAPSDIVKKYGNQSSASIPCAICHTLGDKEEKAVEVLLSGFGVGLSWASAIVDISHSMISDVQIYQM
ncbi:MULTISPECIES: 3-oxoacyl-[acyl-carrier-protein] synthase III C-terminal domain-containing protein [Vibrio]|nr:MULTISPECIES: 3-oxoacyl-[acyl-carrier-protein] synthase III C-terminal domain-containing protein [Vibrio]MDE1319360.1 ketoacyl-ACP synthase III [Vibrio aestuarianus]MDF9399686.1 ketoacyl-ACP synthase III [Vibrio sp. 1180_3]CAH8242030.1 3-oxoacyl-(acyl-carrier-protein) synthase, KASIII [Vibrio aestuarianus]